MQVDKAHDILDLSSVVHTEACESDDKSMFEFEVHFSCGTGSPWQLRAYTKVGISHPVCYHTCLLYTSPSPRDATLSRMPSSA